MSIIKRVAQVLLLLALAAATALVMLNRYVVEESSKWIVPEAQAAQSGKSDCILVLGAAVYANKIPSVMLEDRLSEGISLYKLGAADKLLMSGDNSKISYNEVKVMKDYAVKAGVPSSDVFQDHAGFSTYESMYRARDVFAAKKIVVVTQNYHLYRALYDARSLGLDAVGVAANPQPYAGQFFRDCREMLARAKDVIYCALQPKPTFLGDVIPVGGDGDVTD